MMKDNWLMSILLRNIMSVSVLLLGCNNWVVSSFDLLRLGSREDAMFAFLRWGLMNIYIKILCNLCTTVYPCCN